MYRFLCFLLLYLVVANVGSVVQVIRAMKLPTHEVHVSINEPPYLDTLVQAKDELKDFFRRDKALHMDQEERTKIALMAQVSCNWIEFENGIFFNLCIFF